MLGRVGHQIAHVPPHDQDAIQDEACMPDICSAKAERLLVSSALSGSSDTVLQDHMPASPKRLLTTKLVKRLPAKHAYVNQQHMPRVVTHAVTRSYVSTVVLRL